MSDDTRVALYSVIAIIGIVMLVFIFVGRGWSYATRAELWELERRIDVLESR